MRNHVRRQFRAVQPDHSYNRPAPMTNLIPALLLTLFTAAAHAATPWCSAANPASGLGKSLLASADRRAGERPRAVVRVHTEGTLPHQGIWDQSVEAKKDLPLIRDLAMAWQTSRDRGALERLSTLLEAWADIYQPSFNPIDETEFDFLIDAYAIAGPALPAATRDKTGRLIRKWGEGYVEQMAHQARAGKGTWINNWQSHRIKLATMAAVALNDSLLFAAARAEFRKQLGQNLRADGSTIDFAERDALHYTVYDLEPLTRAALAAATRGEDWLHLQGDNGATLAAALDWLLPYARGERTHLEYVHTTVKFDLQRRDAGVPGFTGPWEPKTSGQLFWLAAKLDGRYRDVAQGLMNEPPWVAACW